MSDTAQLTSLFHLAGHVHRGLFRLIIEIAPGEPEGPANLSNRVSRLRPQCLNELALFRRGQLNHVDAFF